MPERRGPLRWWPESHYEVETAAEAVKNILWVVLIFAAFFLGSTIAS